MMTFTSSASAMGATVRFTAMALAAAGAMALAGCENPEPTAAPEQATAAPPPGDAALMGAPSTRTPQYVGPAAPAYPPGPPPPQGYGPGYPPPPPPPGPAPQGYAPYPPTAYPPGYGHRTGPGAPGEIVAMAPIPNPPENGWYYGRHYGATPWTHRHRHHVWIYGGGAAAYAGHAWRHRHHHAYAAAPVTARQPAAPPPPAAHHHLAAAAGTAATAAAGAQLLKPHAPTTHRHRVDQTTSAAAAGGPTNTAANETGAGTEADRYKALESQLHDAFESTAVLTVPANMTPGQAATVTLTLPALFAQAAQQDAAHQGLADDAASMNLLATLTGDGYTITPVEAQTVALGANQPVSFSWQVTPGSGARGPLKANVRAQVVSAGQYLNLGDKAQGDSLMAGKVIGIGLLVLIAALVLGWALRRRPNRTQTVVRRPAYDQYPTTPPSGK